MWFTTIEDPWLTWGFAGSNEDRLATSAAGAIGSEASAITPVRLWRDAAAV
jgi:hypothetical protein